MCPFIARVVDGQLIFSVSGVLAQTVSRPFMVQGTEVAWVILARQPPPPAFRFARRAAGPP